jgi:hypothetical protein
MMGEKAARMSPAISSFRIERQRFQRISSVTGSKRIGLTSRAR